MGSVNEFLLVLIYFPVAVGILSIIGTLVWKRFYLMPAGTFVLFTILTYTCFNDSFFIWVVVYTGLSLVASLVTYGVYQMFLRGK
ncbi:hypothetical protein C2W64_00782 [Brevibacillus laterosporus]|nr:YbeF family protein [Brevibacillus laterosporus]RAP27633.1 hypothetical protein C2W64_00782 [Brevibacillus laterosporus]